MSQAPRELNFGLSLQDWALLKSLAVEPLRNLGATVWIFGSRARGTYRTHSDVDLLFRLTSGSLPSGSLHEIKTSLEDSNLSVKVDIVSDAELAPSYRASVEADRIEVRD